MRERRNDGRSVIKHETKKSDVGFQIEYKMRSEPTKKQADYLKQLKKLCKRYGLPSRESYPLKTRKDFMSAIKGKVTLLTRNGIDINKEIAEEEAGKEDA